VPVTGAMGDDAGQWRTFGAREVYASADVQVRQVDPASGYARGTALYDAGVDLDGVTIDTRGSGVAGDVSLRGARKGYQENWDRLPDPLESRLSPICRRGACRRPSCSAQLLAICKSSVR